MKTRSTAVRNFLLGGLLPIAAFVVVEQVYGTIGGVIAGVVFGGGEIAWEFFSFGKVQAITLLSNGLILVLGMLSIWEGDGLFFKLQPAIFMAIFAGVMLVSSALRKPFLVEMVRKQNPNLTPEIMARFRGLNFRLGIYFIFLAALSVHSAVYWITASWALLKTVGLPVLMAVYVVVEAVIIRIRVRRGVPPSPN